MGNYEKKVTYAKGIYYDKSTELKESIEILKIERIVFEEELHWKEHL